MNEENDCGAKITYSGKPVFMETTQPLSLPHAPDTLPGEERY
jgi:hypothetical protein